MEEEMGSGQETNLYNTHMRIIRSTSQLGHILQLQQRPSPLSCVTEKEPYVTGNIPSNEINLSMFSDAGYCYSLLEAMPLPGPTWSTTAPCVLAKPPSSFSSAPPIEGSLELEWGSENQEASSYSWWLGFLESLDEKKLDHTFGEKNVGMENARVLSLEPSFVVDAIDNLSCCPDDWLMIPTLEKDLEDMENF